MAKVGRTKHGACDMVYKPEHISDLESGAIIHAEVRPGDAADNDATLKERLMAARATLKQVLPKARRSKAGARKTDKAAGRNARCSGPGER